MLLRLLGAYDSNDFQRLIYPLNKAVRNKTLDEATPEFDKMLNTARICWNVSHQESAPRASYVATGLVPIVVILLEYRRHAARSVHAPVAQRTRAPVFGSGARCPGEAFYV